MPRSPEDNQQIRDARREVILTAAARVFADKGFGHTKISDIAAAAGQSHGLVYHYFASKEAVFAAIVDLAMERVNEDLTIDAPTPMKRLEAIVDRVLERVGGAPEVGVLLSQVLLLGGIPDAIRVSMIDHARHFYDAWVEMVREGQELGEITREASAEELAGMLLCAIRGLAVVAHGMKEAPAGTAPLPTHLPTRATLLRFLRPSAADAARSASGASRSRSSVPTSSKETRGRHVAKRPRASAPKPARAR